MLSSHFHFLHSHFPHYPFCSLCCFFPFNWVLTACVSKSIHIMMTSLFWRSQLSAIRVVLIQNIDKTISFNLPKSFFVSWQKGVVVHLFEASLCRWFVWDCSANFSGPFFNLNMWFSAKGAIKALHRSHSLLKAAEFPTEIHPSFII